MANKREPKQSAEQPERQPEFWATEKYKSWVTAQRLARGWTLDELAEQLKSVDSDAKASSGGLVQFLGPEEGPPAGPSRTTLMPAINKLFGAAEPPVCDPLDPFSQMRDRIAARWASMTPTERTLLLTILGLETQDANEPDRGPAH